MKKIKIYSCEASKENIFGLGSWQEKENEVLKKKEEKGQRRNRKRKRTVALKLKEREGWNREFFNIYFPSNLLRKIMVNSFMLNLIFSMN